VIGVVISHLLLLLLCRVQGVLHEQAFTQQHSLVRNTGVGGESCADQAGGMVQSRTNSGRVAPGEMVLFAPRRRRPGWVSPRRTAGRLCYDITPPIRGVQADLFVAVASQQQQVKL
jgi:hypothetical protein